MNKLPRYLYSLLAYLAMVPLLVYFLLRSRRDGRYRQRLYERLGFGYRHCKPGGLVVHAVSVGEVVAATPLIKALHEAYPQLPLTITCTTPTGSATIRQRFGEGFEHYYLPLDCPGPMRRFLNSLQPRAVIILETELWPNLMAQCYRAQIPVIVANARLSARSARGYRRFYCFTAALMRHILLLLAQDRDSARRFARLRLSQRIEITGNLKFDMHVPASVQTLVQQFTSSLQGRLVWVAGSTHEGEDEILLGLHRRLRRQFPALLLILVPRHPERFERVAEMIRDEGFSLWRRSSDTLPAADVEVGLADSMGELLAWYQLADLVFVGGSLVDHGGHNPLEAACFGKAIQSGMHHFNFAEAYSQLQRREAVSLVEGPDDLLANARQLLADPEHRRRQGARAQRFFQQQQGVTLRTLQAIERILGPEVSQFRQCCLGSCVYWYQTDFFEAIAERHFDPRWWQAQDAVLGSAGGRNVAWFVRLNQRDMVLRHYCRGGLVGRFVADRFRREPVLQSRAMQEFSLLQWMHQQGLPVPRPCAARFCPEGRWYRADILVEHIADSLDLARLLQQRPLTTGEWRAVGAAVAQMHSAGVYHADLNCHNILLDAAGKVWLIDFDRCGRRPPGAWQGGNLQRLRRSLRKEQGRLPVFHWHERDWSALLESYRLSLAS